MKNTATWCPPPPKKRKLKNIGQKHHKTPVRASRMSSLDHMINLWAHISNILLGIPLLIPQTWLRKSYLYQNKGLKTPLTLRYAKSSGTLYNVTVNLGTPDPDMPNTGTFNLGDTLALPPQFKLGKKTSKMFNLMVY